MANLSTSGFPSLLDEPLFHCLVFFVYTAGDNPVARNSSAVVDGVGDDNDDVLNSGHGGHGGVNHGHQVSHMVLGIVRRRMRIWSRSWSCRGMAMKADDCVSFSILQGHQHDHEPEQHEFQRHNCHMLSTFIPEVPPLKQVELSKL